MITRTSYPGANGVLKVCLFQRKETMQTEVFARIWLVGWLEGWKGGRKSHHAPQESLLSEYGYVNTSWNQL